MRPKWPNTMAIFIGIDPGVNTGLAIWDTARREFLRVDTCTIVEAMAHIMQIPLNGMGVTLVTEDARQRKWIPREKSLSEFKGRAMGAGSVKRDSQIWEEFAAYWGIRHVQVPPRKGLTKWDAESFARITGWKGRTSHHARDAALLVYQATPRTFSKP